ncbi:MAG: 4-diphosphocytidyl-2-C-methyl-D-erythritol kinase [Candidatus Kapaibacterium sp.]|nr:MAG: 4-diphosphocytidyl-2-C-methyl-D-erythritol kinase [Candidatus Kapabacteria bacterium]
MNNVYKSYAKINLGLEILEKRPDGYHNIYSIFLPITLFDEIHFKTASNFTITIEPNNIEIQFKENIIYKTIKLIQNKYKININSLHIHLVKRIPIGAGLGGGSSNAATTLLALNELFKLNLDKEQLIELARKLGADVPFFIDPRPSLVSGIGDIIEPIDFPFDFDILVVYPNFQISTAYAYSLIENLIPKKPTNIQKVINSLLDLSTFKEYFSNDFEKYLFPKFPALGEIKSKLYELGAQFASLSGSGSAVYGVFQKGSINKIDLSQNFQTFHCDLLKN